MIIRTYFDKTNTIVKDSTINTGKNPITELYYGTNNNGNQEFSRLLFHFDTDLVSKYFKDTDSKHVIKMVNTGVFNNDLLNTTTGDGKKRTSSFDLVLFELPTEFDGGTGYDYEQGVGTTNSENPSNWYFARTETPWVEGLSGTTTDFGDVPLTILKTQSFADGNENLEMDITDVVNDILNGDKVNNGFGVAFSSDLETFEVEGLQYVGFFTPNTQTFYQPYLESKHVNPISDDRSNFYMGKDSKLYLYITKGGVPEDWPVGMVIDINDSNGQNVFSDLVATRERTGVYSVMINILEVDGLKDQVYYDVWKSSVDGTVISEMQFQLKPSEDYLKIGSYDTLPEDVRVDIRGIKHNERIRRGDVRKVYVNAVVPYTVNEHTVVDKAEYRLFVKEGNLEHTVIDYTSVEKTFNNNYFLLDTASLLPNTYYLDIKMYSNMEVRTTPNTIIFEILD